MRTDRAASRRRRAGHPPQQGGTTVYFMRRAKGLVHLGVLGFVGLGLFFLGMTSCKSPHRPTRRTETYLGQGFPKGNDFFTHASYSEIRAALPAIAGAEYVNDDEFCLTCHDVYTQTFAHNVHRGIHSPDGGQSCEAC